MAIPFQPILQALSVAFATGAPAPAPAAAEAIKFCPLLPHDRLTAGLAQRHGERTAGFGLTSGGQLVELLLAPDGATWTLIATSAEGLSCILAEGRDWRGAAAPEGPRT